MTETADGVTDDLFAGATWHYARYRPDSPRRFFDELVRRLRLDGAGRLLDLGCGTGQLTVPLARHMADAVGMDPRTHGARRSHPPCGSRRDCERRVDARRFGGSTRWARPLPALVTMGRSFHRMLLGDRRTAFEQLVTDTSLAIDPGGCFIERVTLEVLTATRR
ncbi:methyltransferase domain-containing protein [Nocardia sp. NPDC004750]